MAIVVAVEAIERLKKKYNPYACMALGIGMIAVINSGIDYLTTAIVKGAAETVWIYALTAFMGRGIALVYSLVTLKILNMLKSKKA